MARGLAVAAILTILMGSMIPAQTVSGSKPNVKVGFYYYVWYGEGPNGPDVLGGRHWNDSDFAPVVDKPILGYYSSQNGAIIRQHLHWFRELGIGFLIVSWWGPYSYEDNTTKKLFSVAKQDDYPIELVIMVEPYNQSGLYDFEAIYDYINNTYVKPYDSIYMRLNGLPLVCFFNDNINMTRTPDNRTAIRSVSGFTPRIVGHSDYVDWWAWPQAGCTEALEPILRQDGYVGILPRYDDTRIPASTNTTYDVNYTEGLYDKQWNATLRLINESKVNLVAIYSWNEYHERSQIEPLINEAGNYVLSPFSKTYHYMQIIPELPSLAVLTSFLATTLLAVTVHRRRNRKHQST